MCHFECFTKLAVTNKCNYETFFNQSCYITVAIFTFVLNRPTLLKPHIVGIYLALFTTAFRSHVKPHLPYSKSQITKQVVCLCYTVPSYISHNKPLLLSYFQTIRAMHWFHKYSWTVYTWLCHNCHEFHRVLQCTPWEVNWKKKAWDCFSPEESDYK